MLLRSIEMAIQGAKGLGASSSSRSIRGRLRECARLVVLLVASLQLISSNRALADDVHGEWDSPKQDNWPLVPVHATLTPDGRVLTFGSDSGGKATGFFIYDVWDPAAGLSGGHVTLSNTTGTDIFCGTSVLRDPSPRKSVRVVTS